MRTFYWSVKLRRLTSTAVLVLIVVTMIFQLITWNVYDKTLMGQRERVSAYWKAVYRSGVTVFDVDGKHLINAAETYPKYPGFDMILVGYGRTTLGNCTGPACTLNNGRKPIKVVPNREPTHCREIAECVTVTVKTKGRIQWVNKLITSVREHYAGIKFVIVDELETTENESDSFPSDLTHSGITYVKTTPGIGYGRKMALMLTETKYALVMDDDFTFTHRTNLTKMVDLLERSSADIVGGYVTDHGFFDGLFRVADRCEMGRCYPSQFNYAGAFYEQVPLFEHCFVGDRVKNFFLADRHAVLGAGSWDTSRPFFEHEDFFVQMRLSGITVVFCSDIIVKHNTTDRYLAALRTPHQWIMARQFLVKWGFTAVYECNRHMYLIQTNCESWQQMGPKLDLRDGNPAVAFQQTRVIV